MPGTETPTDTEGTTAVGWPGTPDIGGTSAVGTPVTETPAGKLGATPVAMPGIKEGPDISPVGTVSIPDGIVAVLSF